MISVARLSTAPVKGLGLSHPAEVQLEAFGVAGDRRFLLLTPELKTLDVRRHGQMMAVTSESDEEGRTLRLRFPGGLLEGEIELQGEPFDVDLWGKAIAARRVAGAWSDRLSSHAGTEIVLARVERAGEGNDGYPVSLVSNASVDELSRRGGRDDRVDPGRFRMLLELDGCRPHEEDEWLGRDVRVGEAIIRVAEHDARCVITTMNPETGQVDFPTLKTIASYRGASDGSLNFGMYAEVEQPGPIRVGDAVEPLPLR